MAADSFHEGRYGMAAFHLGMAATDLTLAKAGASAVAKLGLKGAARIGARELLLGRRNVKPVPAIDMLARPRRRQLGRLGRFLLQARLVTPRMSSLPMNVLPAGPTRRNHYLFLANQSSEWNLISSKPRPGTADLPKAAVLSSLFVKAQNQYLRPKSSLSHMANNMEFPLRLDIKVVDSDSHQGVARIAMKFMLLARRKNNYVIPMVTNSAGEIHLSAERVPSVY